MALEVRHNGRKCKIERSLARATDSSYLRGLLGVRMDTICN